MEVSGQLHVLAAIPPGKSPRYPLDRKLDEPQSRSRHCGVEIYSLPLPRIEPRDVQSVARRYTDELSPGLLAASYPRRPLSFVDRDSWVLTTGPSSTHNRTPTETSVSLRKGLLLLLVRHFFFLVDGPSPSSTELFQAHPQWIPHQSPWDILTVSSQQQNS
jgi:hypothetical protein